MSTEFGVYFLIDSSHFIKLVGVFLQHFLYAAESFKIYVHAKWCDRRALTLAVTLARGKSLCLNTVPYQVEHTTEWREEVQKVNHHPAHTNTDISIDRCIGCRWQPCIASKCCGVWLHSKTWPESDNWSVNRGKGGEMKSRHVWVVGVGEKEQVLKLNWKSSLCMLPPSVCDDEMQTPRRLLLVRLYTAGKSRAEWWKSFQPRLCIFLATHNTSGMDGQEERRIW